ncbi:MAG: DNA polymerase IV [Eubacteriales bacterium]|nr:DNA polymerase IV [Eubacteriales bacterium]
MKHVVFLVDMNAFFISCEMTRNPTLKGKPAAVAGDPIKRTGIILAANYEARALGIKTTMLLNEARKLCPELLVVPPDHDFYEIKSAEVMALLHEFTPIVEQNSIDEAWLDMTGTEGLLGQPVVAAQAIMATINQRLDLWCSIGISDNKFLAKMASEMKKPQGITELWPTDVPTKLWPLPVGAMYGVGRKSAEKMNRLGIMTAGDLAKLNPDYLISLFGKGGDAIYQHAHGRDVLPVVSRLHDSVKSIGRAITLAENVSDIKKAKLVLMQLADEVARTARKQGVIAKTVQITLKYTDFVTVTRQSAVLATQNTYDIYQVGCKLLDANWSIDKPIRLIGISLTNFAKPGSEQLQPQQLSLFDQPEQSKMVMRQKQVDLAMDSIRNRYGQDSVKRASLLHKDTDN